MTVLSFPSPEDKSWKLLEEKSINDRTIIVWYSPEKKMISLVLFNLTDQPNEISKKAPHSNWGFLTHYISQMYSEKEAAEVVSLYLKDMESGKAWWELIN
jgi:hypothetical protein